VQGAAYSRWRRSGDAVAVLGPIRTIAFMARRGFAHRTETFGFDMDKPWALDALRLLFQVPRAYQPLVDAWDLRHPGSMKALSRLTQMGFVEYQPAIIVDTRTGRLAERISVPLPRYRTTSKGHRFSQEVHSDLRVLHDNYPRLTNASSGKVASLLFAFDLDGSHSRYGLSVPHAKTISGLPERSARWWVRKLLADGHLKELALKIPDVREVVPAHWRPTRLLARQLQEVLDEFAGEQAGALKAEFRLGRSRFLGPVDPARVGISGATDFDHDVEAQRILAALLRSPRCVHEKVFNVEPRLVLDTDTSSVPWRFLSGAPGHVFYQPDAELRERDENAVLWSVVEYERFQSRRDAWSHIERFLGWIHLRALPFESAVLRFVVDSESRVRSYVELIEAFADHVLDNPEVLPANRIVLAVSSVDRVLAASDPLDPRAWFRIALPAGEGTPHQPVLHDVKHSPYDDYFGRS